jgi:hypothetical protein
VKEGTPVDLELCLDCGELPIDCFCVEREWAAMLVTVAEEEEEAAWAAEHKDDLAADLDREARSEGYR